MRARESTTARLCCERIFMHVKTERKEEEKKMENENKNGGAMKE
jgi:hypothetical protein